MHTHSSLPISNGDVAWYTMAIMAGALVVLLVNTILDPMADESNPQASHEIMLQVDMATAQLIEWQLRQL